MRNTDITTMTGRLADQPKFYPSDGEKQHFITFPFAINRDYKKGDEVVEDHFYLDVVAHGHRAQLLNDSVKKGHKLLILGHHGVSLYEDSETGKSHKRVQIVIDSFEFLEPKEKPQKQSQGDAKNKGKKKGSKKGKAVTTAVE